MVGFLVAATVVVVVYLGSKRLGKPREMAHPE
jgi:hypothetical protein